MTSVSIVPVLVLVMSVEETLSDVSLHLPLNESGNITNKLLQPAERIFATGIPQSSREILLGWQDRITTHLPRMNHSLDGLKIPESFDWRYLYSICPTCTIIRDQGCCGSCWAVAAAGVMSDRIGIHSVGTKNVYISENNILSCSGDGGCNGGHPIDAFQYWIDKGVVSGGPYGSNKSCQPYEISPYCSANPSPTPACKKICCSGYSKSYDNDLYFGATQYTVNPDEKQIRAEILIDGPVVVGLYVCPDFFDYRHGVYEFKQDCKKPNHAVKIIGWGTENKTNYWLCANSWGVSWGDGGYFKIARGENNCNMEEYIFAALP